ncbi:MAG: SDR family NAD(P)-dependent oxidoreductase [Dysosmobacter welbionis]
MADRAAVEAMVRTAEAELGPVSLLVNNAGIAGQIQFQDITDAQWNRYLGVNLGGARNTIQAVLPLCSTRRQAASSTSHPSGDCGSLLRGGVCLHQSRSVGLTRSLALELAPPTSGSTAWLPASSTPTWFRSWDRRPCGSGGADASGTAGDAGGRGPRRCLSGLRQGILPHGAILAADGGFIV